MFASIMFGILVYIFLLLNISSSSQLEGHLKPLGYQKKSEGHIDVVEDIPDPKTFFEVHVKGSKPVVFKGAAKNLPAFHLWSDDFLSEKFGHIEVDIEEGKKENRSLGAWTWPLKEFIEKYKNEDVYMVHTLPKEMWRDLFLLPCLSCGGFSNVLQMLVMWFSSGGTNSVLHNDAIDNINCLFSGSKSLYMVDWKHHKLVDFDNAEGSHSMVNVDAVDLNKYPGLAQAPWWEANMEAGDCLFIPYKWIHQVRSSPDKTMRNMAVNVWFYHLKDFNISNCDDTTANFLPLNGLDISNSNTKAIHFLLLLQMENNKEIETKTMFKRLYKYYFNSGIKKSELINIKNILDKDKDHKISIDEINNLTNDELVAISLVFPGLYSEEGGSTEGYDDDIKEPDNKQGKTGVNLKDDTEDSEETLLEDTDDNSKEEL